MTPLEAARRMVGMNRSVFLNFDTDGEPYTDGDPHATARFQCVFCSVKQAFVSDEQFVHRIDCPSLSMPRIVAALEAAELVAIAYEESRVIFGDGGSQMSHAMIALDDALDEPLGGAA